MSMDEGEYAADEYMRGLYEEHKEIAIEEFAIERLQTYYLENRLLAKSAMNALLASKDLISVNSTASFLFSAIAIEVGLKIILLKPIVYGLVQTDAVAELITNLTVSRTSMKKYRGLLMHILKEHGGVDFDKYVRVGARKILWEEINEIQKTRNAILHRGEITSNDLALMAIEVAEEILETIFPAVLKNMGLHLHEGFRICDDWKCRP